MKEKSSVNSIILISVVSHIVTNLHLLFSDSSILSKFPKREKLGERLKGSLDAGKQIS